MLDDDNHAYKIQSRHQINKTLHHTNYTFILFYAWFITPSVTSMTSNCKALFHQAFLLQMFHPCKHTSITDDLEAPFSTLDALL